MITTGKNKIIANPKIIPEPKNNNNALTIFPAKKEIIPLEPITAEVPVKTAAIISFSALVIATATAPVAITAATPAISPATKLAKALAIVTAIAAPAQRAIKVLILLLHCPIFAPRKLASVRIAS